MTRMKHGLCAYRICDDMKQGSEKMTNDLNKFQKILIPETMGCNEQDQFNRDRSGVLVFRFERQLDFTKRGWGGVGFNVVYMRNI